MKIRVDIDENLTDDEVLIRCRSLTEQVLRVQQAVNDVLHVSEKFPLYRDNTEYYIPLNEILFFQTEGTKITAHTKEEMYETQHKLYELEDMLPGFFYESVKINDFKHESYLFHQPQPDRIKPCGIPAQPQAGVCLALLL